MGALAESFRSEPAIRQRRDERSIERIAKAIVSPQALDKRTGVAGLISGHLLRVGSARLAGASRGNRG